MDPVRFMHPDAIRALFSTALSAMYKQEVPLYGDLLDLVADVNAQTLAAQPALAERLRSSGDEQRLSVERHGAIRVGTAEELQGLRRLFAVMGMAPVGYYDLSIAAVPVHATAFRPIEAASLRANPFRVFTSLLRLELIEDPQLREQACQLLNERTIFTPGVMALIDRHERDGGLTETDAHVFVKEALETFRWHQSATVSAEQYRALHDQHRLIADVVAFRGPHINHLTPRTLDIDRAQAQMRSRGMTPKAVIEGPPPRQCPILLRQTSFKALQEAVTFAGGDGAPGYHTARFGEIEQRGAALTPAGKALYDRLLSQARQALGAAPSADNAEQYALLLKTAFSAFPDDYASLRTHKLAYFNYFVRDAAKARGTDLETLIEQGAVGFEPLVYEDFLPVSAAGIFQSNLGDSTKADAMTQGNQQQLEAALGARVIDETTLYAQAQAQSIASCLRALEIQAPSA
ncbi:VOC family protein [Pseudomonas fulva]|uniref:2-oxoadipate dioxygenase/decarboxylase HglS n=1 Tax=Pseudomonas fulva TaxID=47880 RepID=UPI0018A8E3BF|nr:VOC family protein [Pseudomonas fulva]MBF8773997.1 VOC family protein [Pseudomonas fulva]